MHPGKRSVAKNLEDMALAAIGFSEKLIPLGVTLLADAGLLERHRQVMQERGRGPKEVFDLVPAYVEEEQRLSRINQHAKPLDLAFTGHSSVKLSGRNLFPMKDEEFVRDLVTTLVQGLSLAHKERERATRKRR